MESKTQRGFFVLADISGYTGFMAGTELEHAHDIVGELLELIVGQLTPTLTLSKLEGDAVFAYAPDNLLSRGESLVELIESTYVVFRNHVENIRRRSTCQCNACRAVTTLDLKFLVHHGEYVVQNVLGSHELAGTAVNLAHRLLKNHICEETGWRAYALYTRDSVECLGIPVNSMHAQVETYEHLGDVQTYTTNLHEYYDQFTQMRRIFIRSEQADLILGCDCAAPPCVVWDWINDAAKRSMWMFGTRWRMGVGPSGRTTVGARNHCAHGKNEQSLEEILDWRPFEYVTSSYSGHKGKEEMRQTITLESLNGGAQTRVTCNFRLQASLPKPLRRVMASVMLTKVFKYDESFRLLHDLIDQNVQPAN